MNTNYSDTSPAARRGFTLLELIISVALVLVLMLAITKIFSITSTTIGASQGISAAVRDARAAQAVFSRDIAAMAPDSPFVWIRSDAPFSAYRNADDENGDLDKTKLTIDLDGNGVEGENTIKGEDILGFTLNYRRHRLDRFSFCARDRFTRQTGNSYNVAPASKDVTVSGLSSPEAWIQYGPLCLPNKNGSFQLTDGSGKSYPGDGGSLSNNPNNYYANQWILGRMAALMIAPPSGGDITEGTPPVVQQYYQHVGGMSPFSVGSTSKNATPASLIQDGRYDLIGLDIAQTKSLVLTVGSWWTLITNFYFEVNPFILKPINAATASHQVPVFVTGSSQFIVEFAGDFVEQNDAGAVVDVNANGTALEPDGNIDFVVVNGVRQIRWYGYPRDTNNDGVLNAADGDVVPVSDFALPVGTLYSNSTVNPYARFEHFTSTTALSKQIYTATPSFGTYYAAFGPDSINNPQNPRPRMYRITMTIDRPEMAGRTADGQTFEYVFNAP